MSATNKDKDSFWAMQGLKSFCKAKNDWLPYGRVHLSFVRHTGKEDGCKQQLAIEGGVKLHGADGLLYLAELVMSGGVKQCAARSREKAGANGYAAPIFTCMGGTISARAKDGKCIFRQFALAPGTKSDYVMSMMMCAGEESATGGVQPVKGAQRETIYVSLSAADLVDFSRSVLAEYTAYRTAIMLNAYAATPASASAPEPDTEQHTAPESAPTATEEAKAVAVIYDTVGCINRGQPYVVYASDAEEALKDAIIKMRDADEHYVCGVEDFRTCLDFLESEQHGSIVVPLAGKNSGKKANIVLTIDDITPMPNKNS